MSMRMRFIALGVAVVVLTLGWFVVGYRPSKAKLKTVRQDVSTTQAEVAQLTAKLQHLQELKKNAESLKAEQAKLDHALPTKSGVSDFIRDVQDVANQAHIEFLSVAPSLPTAPTTAAAAAPPAPTDTTASPTPAPTTAPDASPAATSTTPEAPAAYQQISVSITATSKFFELEDFVSKLEHLKRAIRINTFGLQSSGDAPAGASPPLSMTIQLTMFQQSAPAAPTQSVTTTTSGTEAP